MALEFKKKTGDGDGKSAVGGQKNDTMLKIMDFFEKNPILKIVIPFLLFIILVVIFATIIFGDKTLLNDNSPTKNTTANVGTSDMVDVLPEDSKIDDKDILSVIERDPLSPDVLSKAKYTGYTNGSSGLKTAIIQVADGDNIVLSLGDTVGDSKWELVEITKEYVTFKAGDNTKKLTRAK